MEKIVLDFTGCNYLREIHQVIKKGLEFPDYYGENLSALWDCLRYYCDYPLKVEIVGISKFANKDLDHQEYISKIFKIFDRVHESTPNIEFVLIS